MVSEHLDFQNTGNQRPKPLEVIPIEPPPREQRVRRNADFAAPGEKKTRYTLPTSLESATTVGYRMRISMSRDEARAVLPLLALQRPTAFAAPETVTEAELFEESEECKAAVAELLREVMPWSMSVFVPPNWDMRYPEAYGFTLEEIFAFGMRSVEAK